jgi:hypothetical protein
LRDKSWDTSVSELLRIFRNSLLSVIPSLREAQIPVGVALGSDAWDEISEVLFRHIVADGIRHALPPFDMEEFHLPEYEMDYEDYSGMSVIAVRQKGETGQNERRLVFHSFSGEALDHVLCVPVEADGTRRRDGEPVALEWGSVHFICYQSTGSSFRMLDELRILL